MIISELSTATNIPISTIRYYDKLGIFSPTRAENGYRIYPENSIELLLLISQAKKLGFSLSEIKSMVDLLQGPRRSGELRNLLEKKVIELDEKLKEIKKMKRNVLKLLDSNCPL